MNDDVGSLIEPAPVSFTWGAPGWYFVGGVLLLLLIGAIYMFYRHRQKNKYRKFALSWLQTREKILSGQPDQLIYDAAMLMKRIAITRYGRAEVAAIRDNEWIRFLNTSCKSSLFAESDTLWLNEVLYLSEKKVNEADTRGFLEKTKKWIKSHRYAL